MNLLDYQLCAHPILDTLSQNFDLTAKDREFVCCLMDHQICEAGIYINGAKYKDLYLVGRIDSSRSPTNIYLQYSPAWRSDECYLVVWVNYITDQPRTCLPRTLTLPPRWHKDESKFQLFFEKRLLKIK
jgi:hypothetical protein